MTKIQQATLPAPRAYIIYAARSWAGGGQKSPITALILSKPALFKGLAKSVLTESGCPNVGRGRPDGSHGCPDAGDGRPNALHGRLFAAENGFTPALTTAMVGTVRCAVRIAERSVRRCLPERTKTFRAPSVRCPALPRLPPDSPPMPLANGGMRQRRHRSAMSLPTPSLSRFPGLVPGKSTTTTHHR